MIASTKRFVLWTLVAVLIGAGLLVAFAPQRVTVDLVVAKNTAMAVTINEEAKTRVHDVFTLSSPVNGKLQRLEAHVGDAVVMHETILARIQPVDPAFLDPRSENQAQASIQAAKSALALARAEVERASAELEYAETEHKRAQTLLVEGTITRREADAARRAYKTNVANLQTTNAALQIRQFELERASAQLMSPTQTLVRPSDCECINVTAPVNGKVLTLINPSARVVQAGEPLLEIGDPQQLEIVADYLSSDAVNIAAGQKVIIDNWGGDKTLEGKVRYVEPYGFTKTSALGIEEQRVNTIIDLVSPKQEWNKLGHGYQVETQVVLWHNPEALTVPLTSLFRDGTRWSVFIAKNGRAALRHVDVGERNGLVAQISGGLSAGDRVIAHPSNKVRDGVTIRERDSND